MCCGFFEWKGIIQRTPWNGRTDDLSSDGAELVLVQFPLLLWCQVYTLSIGEVYEDLVDPTGSVANPLV